LGVDQFVELGIADFFFGYLHWRGKFGWPAANQVCSQFQGFLKSLLWITEFLLQSFKSGFVSIIWDWINLMNWEFFFRWFKVAGKAVRFFGSLIQKWDFAVALCLVFGSGSVWRIGNFSFGDSKWRGELGWPAANQVCSQFFCGFVFLISRGQIFFMAVFLICKGEIFLWLCVS
jgi:hypothetical protein